MREILCFNNLDRNSHKSRHEKIHPRRSRKPHSWITTLCHCENGENIKSVSSENKVREKSYLRGRSTGFCWWNVSQLTSESTWRCCTLPKKSMCEKNCSFIAEIFIIWAHQRVSQVFTLSFEWGAGKFCHEIWVVKHTHTQVTRLPNTPQITTRCDCRSKSKMSQRLTINRYYWQTCESHITSTSPD